jgi:hypothetical protein
MLTVENCRKILQDNGEDYTEEEVEKIREFLYKMAKIVIESTQQENNENDKKI